MNTQAHAPLTPALRGLQGEAPLVYLTRHPARNTPDEPEFELAVFDDGTFVFEGHRCVEVGGVTLTHLDGGELSKVEGLLATFCTGIDDARADELCPESARYRVACSNGQSVEVGSDHCRAENEGGVGPLVAALRDQLGLDAWLGQPTRRQACALGARDLAPHELARTVRSDLADAGR
jgi:hypothetical protein